MGPLQRPASSIPMHMSSKIDPQCSQNAHRHVLTPNRSHQPDPTSDFDTSLPLEVRKYLGTYGLTPPAVESFDTQAKRCTSQCGPQAHGDTKIPYHRPPTARHEAQSSRKVPISHASQGYERPSFLSSAGGKHQSPFEHELLYEEEKTLTALLGLDTPHIHTNRRRGLRPLVRDIHAT